MTTNIVTHVFTGKRNIGSFGDKTVILNVVHPFTGKSIHGDYTQAELETRYGTPITIMTWAEFEALHDDEWRAAPTVITRAKWEYQLNVLPPVDLHTSPDGVTFKMSERLSGEMTTICARVDGVYYKLIDHITLSHAAIIAHCRQAAHADHA